MNIRELFERALFLVSVPKCVCCKEPLDFGDRALCKSCLVEYYNYRTRNCSRCSKPYNRCSCSNFYLERNYVKKLVKVYRYDKHREDLPGNHLIFSLKHDNRRDTFNFLTNEMLSAISASVDLRGNKESFLITNVPRRNAAIIKDGYDHAAELARRVAKRLGIRYCQFLVSHAKRPQKSMTMSERRENVRFGYKRRKLVSLKGVTVILVDDVVTSGNSMAKCARLLKGLGAKQIIGATIAIAYKDSHIKPQITKY